MIYVVCWSYVVEKNCNKCSSYFSVKNDDEAIRRCKQKGFAEPNYFPRVYHVSWGGCSHIVPVESKRLTESDERAILRSKLL